MQRSLLTCLMIVIVLTGCSTPATPRDVLPQANIITPAHPTLPTDELPQVVTFTPAPPSQPIDVLQQAATFNPPVSGSLTLKHQTIARVMLDEQYLYWAVDQQEDTIFRAPLNGGNTEKFVTSKFAGGDILVFPPTRTGDWFVYFDHDNSGVEPNWELRAKNVSDGSEKIILSGKGTYTAAFDLFISASGEWIAWSRLLPSTQGTCQESVLGLSNLRTDEQVELDRVCIDQYMWTVVGLSGQTLVAEQDFPDTKGGGYGLYLFDDVHNKQHKPLIDGNASMPFIASPWIVWKNGPRFESVNSNSVYNISDKTRRAIIAPGDYPPDPQLIGQWLYWISNDGTNAPNSIYLYDLKREQAWKISPPTERAFTDTAIYGRWIAWSLRGESAGGDSFLEWAQLP